MTNQEPKKITYKFFPFKKRDIKMSLAEYKKVVGDRYLSIVYVVDGVILPDLRFTEMMELRKNHKIDVFHRIGKTITKQRISK